MKKTPKFCIECGNKLYIRKQSTGGYDEYTGKSNIEK